MKMTEKQMADRLELIRSVAKKRANKAAMDARKWSNTTERSRKAAGNDAYLTSLDENHNHYTDGEKYLAEHYGDRLADQKNYESEEGWNQS